MKKIIALLLVLACPSLTWGAENAPPTLLEAIAIQESGMNPLVVNVAYRQRYGMKALLVEDLDSIDLDIRNWKPLEALSEVQFFKSLQCFLYQCCEGDVDEKPLYKTLSSIRALMAPFIKENSPEYDAAEWG